jgi:hypothetical protein
MSRAIGVEEAFIAYRPRIIRETSGRFASKRILRPRVIYCLDRTFDR